MKPVKNIIADKLRVEVYETRAEMGLAAGSTAAELIRNLLSQKEEVNIIFAAAPSQNEMLSTLCKAEGIEWQRINAFHMDEYIGLSADAPQCFGNFLERHLFSLVPFKSVYRIDCTATDPAAECARYADILKRYPVDLVCLGIGENAHIAFNDPGEAKFDDPELVKVVTLDEVCRKQQVNDGCFAKISDVPTHALTLTVPALMKAAYLICTVPAPTKRDAVKKTVLGPITEDVPATAMRLHDNCIMFCDSDSGADL
jgi:glucosamine-6-phosphate deaminase